MKNFISKNISIFFSLLALCNCTTISLKNQPVRPLHQNIISKYDLENGSRNICLFSPKYDYHSSANLLSNYIPKEKKQVMSYRIQETIGNLSEKASFLQKRYKLFEREKVSNLSRLNSGLRKSHAASPFDLLDDYLDVQLHLDHLAKADMIVRDMPIFLPIKNAAISSKFGMRKLKRGKRRFHKGLDLASAKNAPIYAAADGVIVEVSCLRCYGNYIVIQHKNNLKTKYAHLSRKLVYKGQRVAQGQKIGIQGSTGRSTRDHLHFEILYKKKHLNPYFFVGKETGCEKKKI